MDTITKITKILLAISIVIIVIIFSIVIHTNCKPIQNVISDKLYDTKTIIIKNHSTRDYKFEHYCDSIYEVNSDYYLDVLVETDEFQNYLEEHGQWWMN